LSVGESTPTDDYRAIICTMNWSLHSKVSSWYEMTMADNKNPPDAVRSVMARNLEEARLAMSNYFQFVEKSMSSSPLGATDQARTFRSYVERTVAANFELSDRLLHAEGFQDIVRIQTEFFQAQLRALTEQTKDLGATATEATPEVTRIPIK
jgi:hypothetical protein